MQRNEDNREKHKKAAALVGKLLDAGSFVEYSALSECGVVTGYGAIDSRAVFVFAQYAEMNREHSLKICNLYKAALNMGAPVIALMDSDGMEIGADDTGAAGLEAFAAYGSIFSVMTDASGVIPQICAVIGKCLGTSAFIPNISDFVFMCGDNSAMFLQSPATLPGLDGKTETMRGLGGAGVHASNGLAHFVCDDADELFAGIKELLSFLPSNNLDETPVTIFADDMNRIDESIGVLADEKDIIGIIGSLSDSGVYLEVRSGYAEESTGVGTGAVTALTRLNGMSTGIIGVCGALTPEECDKIAGFACFCDAFNIPIITLQNVVSPYAFTAANHGEMMKNASKMLRVFAAATSPKINVTVGDTYGAPLLLLNGKPLGADISFIWDSAKSGVMNGTAAKKVVGIELNTNPDYITDGLFYDNIIKPSQTRKYLISALELISSKRVQKYAKKHMGVTI